MYRSLYEKGQEKRKYGKAKKVREVTAAKINSFRGLESEEESAGFWVNQEMAIFSSKKLKRKPKVPNSTDKLNLMESKKESSRLRVNYQMVRETSTYIKK